MYAIYIAGDERPTERAPDNRSERGFELHARDDLHDQGGLRVAVEVLPHRWPTTRSNTVVEECMNSSMGVPITTTTASDRRRISGSEFSSSRPESSTLRGRHPGLLPAQTSVSASPLARAGSMCTAGPIVVDTVTLFR